MIEVDKNKPMIMQFCVCLDYKVREGYTTLSPAFDKMIKEYYNVSHGYCPECLSEEMQKLEVMQNVESTTGTYKTIEDKI